MEKVTPVFMTDTAAVIIVCTLVEPLRPDMGFPTKIWPIAIMLTIVVLVRLIVLLMVMVSTVVEKNIAATDNNTDNNNKKQS